MAMPVAMSLLVLAQVYIRGFPLLNNKYFLCVHNIPLNSIWDKTFSVISKDPYLRVFRRGTGLIVVDICRCRRIVKFALNEYKDCGHFLSIMG